MNTYDRLIELMEKYPDLSFDNNGYEEISSAVKEANKEGVQEIETVLKGVIKGFVRFQNFKPRRSGETAVRYQVYYNDERSFRGVAYTPLSWFRKDRT
jgi:hypothetical protein